LLPRRPRATVTTQALNRASSLLLTIYINVHPRAAANCIYELQFPCQLLNCFDQSAEFSDQYKMMMMWMSMMMMMMMNLTAWRRRLRCQPGQGNCCIRNARNRGRAALDKVAVVPHSGTWLPDCHQAPINIADSIRRAAVPCTRCRGSASLSLAVGLDTAHWRPINGGVAGPLQ